MAITPGRVLTADDLTENPDGTVTVRGTETLTPGGVVNAANFGPFPYGVTFTARPNIQLSARAVTDNTGVMINWRSATDEEELYVRYTLAASATSSSAVLMDWEATGFLA